MDTEFRFALLTDCRHLNPWPSRGLLPANYVLRDDFFCSVGASPGATVTNGEPTTPAALKIIGNAPVAFSFQS